MKSPYDDISKKIGGMSTGLYLGSLAGDLFNSGGVNPYASVIPGLTNYTHELQGYRNALSPYFDITGHAIRQLLQSPEYEVNKIMGGYHQSPYAQNLTHQAEQAARAQAAYGGYLGTPQDQEAIAQRIGGIASQDQRNYLHDILGQRSLGLQGGMNFVNQLPQTYGMEGNAIDAQARAMAQKQNYENHRRSFIDSLLGLAGGIVGAFR